MESLELAARREPDLERRLLDTFTKWFSWQRQNSEIWPTVKSAVAEYVGRYGPESRRYEGFFSDACRAAQGTGSVSIAWVLEKFTDFCIAAHAKEVSEGRKALEAEEQLPPTKDWAALLSKHLRVYLVGGSTRREFIESVERDAKANGAWDQECFRTMQSFRTSAERREGGLDGTMGHKTLAVEVGLSNVPF